MDETDRPVGILTNPQREWLLGVSDIDPGSSRASGMRGRVQSRVRNALLDIAILNDFLERDDLIESIELDEHLHIPVDSWRTSYFGMANTTSEDTVDEDIKKAKLDGAEGILPKVEETKLDPRISDALPELAVLMWRLTNGPSTMELVIENGIKQIYRRHHEVGIITHVNVDITVDADVQEAHARIAESRMDQGLPLTKEQTMALLVSDDHSDEVVGEYIRSFS